MECALLFLDNGGSEGTLPITGVLCCFEEKDAEWLREFVELLKPLLRKLESSFTGEGGRKDFDLSPSATTRIDLRIFEWNEVKGAARAGLLISYCTRSKSFAIRYQSGLNISAVVRIYLSL